MPLLKVPDAEPIPGYRLLEPLGRGGFGEVWKCEAPGGLFKAIKFVFGSLNGLDVDGTHVHEELKAIGRIKAFRHPFLLSMERVECIEGELVIVMELADRNLQSLLEERGPLGRSPQGRAELLGYLREAADVLDLMNQRHGLQHLDVKPGNLFLVSNHVKVADFGLVQSLAESSVRPRGGQNLLAAISPRYAAPELFRDAISPQSDQYSLAILYQELLTGTVPFNGRNSRQLAVQHTSEEPDLSLLPERDRGPIARALAKKPEERFASCLDFVQALGGGTERTSVVEFLRSSPSLCDETRGDLSPHTTQPTGPIRGRMLPDYQFVRRLSSSPVEETWEACSAEGRRRRVKFVYGMAGRDPLRDELIASTFESLRHPVLPKLEVLPAGGGSLLFLTDRIDDTLRERREASVALGYSGVPRAELLGYLRAAAEALDYLYQHYGLQHLALHPRSLLLTPEGYLSLADFGLTQLLQLPAGLPLEQLAARYAAPELLRQSIHRTCDQYSLALIFAELLTGTHPFRGQRQHLKNPRKWPAPDLAALPEQDRAVIARALDPDPAVRFPTCTELLEALGGTEPTYWRATDSMSDTEMICQTWFAAAGGGGGGGRTGGVGDEVPAGQRVRELVTKALSVQAESATEVWQPLDGACEVYRGRFMANLPPGKGSAQVLERFRKQWNGEVVRSENDRVVFHVGQPVRWWRRWRRRRDPGLLVEITWGGTQLASLTPVVNVRIRPAERAEVNGPLLQEMAPKLVESLRATLQGKDDRRKDQRILWPHPVLFSVVPPDHFPCRVIPCQGKDLSVRGIGFYLPYFLSPAPVILHLHSAQFTDPVTIRGDIIRVQRCAEGWYEVGVLFAGQ